MKCQLECIGEIGEKNSRVSDRWQYLIRKKRWYWKLLSQRLRPAGGAAPVPQGDQPPIEAGDMVRVRSEADIRLTLDRQRKTRGWTFQKEMFNCCGQEYRVFKRVDRFYDEAKQKMCKCRGIYLLEGACCNGRTAYLRPCGRNCFYFWQSAWLEKV